MGVGRDGYKHFIASLPAIYCIIMYCYKATVDIQCSWVLCYSIIFKLIAVNANYISYFINQKAEKRAKKLSHEIFRMNWRAAVDLVNLKL